jgi:hypothetical protein
MECIESKKKIREITWFDKFTPFILANLSNHVILFVKPSGALHAAGKTRWGG